MIPRSRGALAQSLTISQGYPGLKGSRGYRGDDGDPLLIPGPSPLALIFSCAINGADVPGSTRPGPCVFGEWWEVKQRSAELIPHLEGEEILDPKEKKGAQDVQGSKAKRIAISESIEHSLNSVYDLSVAEQTEAATETHDHPL
ncbi:hypothetical protein MC885_017702 [Smutsia gigantea]|nr:hypothetical protein MC885_017702 [Smutsia gigantea]